MLPHPLAAAMRPQDTVSHAAFSDDRGTYNQKDAEGFIRLNGPRLRTAAKRDQR